MEETRAFISTEDSQTVIQMVTNIMNDNIMPVLMLISFFLGLYIFGHMVNAGIRGRVSFGGGGSFGSDEEFDDYYRKARGDYGYSDEDAREYAYDKVSRK